MDFTALANPEETFFQHGYIDGYAHGRTHGMIEGRAAGKEKGIELWEEVGYYQGFASLLRAAYGNDHGSSRASHHITSLLSAIDRFPAVNSRPKAEEELESQATAAADQLDVSKQLLQIRSRYKALCSVLSIPPRLRSVVTGVESFSSGTAPESAIKKVFVATTKSNTLWPIERQLPDNSTLEL